jgi:hypothetical protein
MVVVHVLQSPTKRALWRMRESRTGNRPELGPECIIMFRIRRLDRGLGDPVKLVVEYYTLVVV